MAKKAKTENSEQDFASIDASCPHYFGYLRARPKGESIPEECLACEKVVECMLSELKGSQAEVEQTQAIEEGEESLEKVTEEIVEKETVKEEIAEKEIEWKIEPKAEIKPQIEAQLSEDQFIVKDMGILYATWTNTVRIPRGILSSWGGKVKEVILETIDGKLEICKVAPLEVEERVIEVPDKVQQSLGIKKGDIIKVRPCI